MGKRRVKPIPRTLFWTALTAAATTGPGCKDAPSSPPVHRTAAKEQGRAEELPEVALDARPLVGLDGKSRPVSVAIVAPGRPRVYARAPRTWVYEEPSRESRRLGYLRAGASSPTTSEPAGHQDCRHGWRRVLPRGYVCVGPKATLDAEDPIVRAVLEHPADHLRKLPYIYGTVRRPGPIYARLPTAEELRKAEPGIDRRMERWLSAEGEIGASYAQHVWLGRPGAVPDPARAWRARRSDSLPPLLREHGSLPNLRRTPRASNQLVVGRMHPRAGYAFLRTFLHEGRRYGISTELKILPTDRLRPIQGSDFHGYEINEDVEFPFAIVRRRSARYWLYQRSTGKRIDAGAAPYRAAIPLTGKQNFFNEVLHYQTKDGKWLSDREASRLDPAKRMPGWAKRGEKWIDINLSKQTLVLYDGERPVFATLISSGEAGLEDPSRTTATKRGIFRIHTKHVTAMMSSDELGEEFELHDVPYVQYFDKEGYAIHGAYWHDRFGMPKSHGCINLSPEDARRVFYFTEPRVPRGWHGALLPLRGTVVFIHP